MTTLKHRSIEVQYNFVLSQDVEQPKNVTPNAASPSSGAYSFPIRGEASEADDEKSYYSGLLSALKEAKRVTGDDLTSWRDAVGDTENNKEASLAKPVHEEDENDIEDGED